MHIPSAFRAHPIAESIFRNIFAPGFPQKKFNSLLTYRSITDIKSTIFYIQRYRTMTKRSVATVIILTLVTCGIYGWYWMYTTSNELQKESGQSQLSPMAILLLSIFLGTVGYALFGYDSAKCIDSLNARRGITSDNNVLYIILGLFIPIVLIGIVQNEINKA